MAKIFIKFEAAIIGERMLDQPVMTFGRKSDNDIVISHAAVSGHHGKLSKEGDSYFVEDLNSTNGTFVNGRRIKKSRLSNKDNVRVAKHIIEFFTDDASKASNVKSDKPAETKPSTPKDIAGQKEELRKNLGIPNPAQNIPPAKPAPLPTGQPLDVAHKTAQVKDMGNPGTIKIVSGGASSKTEYTLKDLVTYIGTSDQAVIKIKGFLAPSLAAAISRRPEGYFLKAVKSGYPKVNAKPINEQVLLESGALIECGGTNMVFYHTDAKKKVQENVSKNKDSKSG